MPTLTPNSPGYWDRFGAGTGRAPYKPPKSRFSPVEQAAITRVNNQRDRRIAAAQAKAKAAAAARTATKAATTTAATTATGPSSWQDYIDMLDKRERAWYDTQRGINDQRTREMLASLQGFGGALIGSAGRAWSDITGAYQRGAEGAGAFQGAIADQYSQGLTQANAQLARDAINVGQGGEVRTVDPKAATAQVQTVGQTDPSKLIGAEGAIWNTYGQTVPGSMAFQMQQDAMQLMRSSDEANQQLGADLRQAMADNPEQGMALWAKIQEQKSAAVEAKLAQTKDRREQETLELQRSNINRQWAQALDNIAVNRTNATGNLWVVKNGRVVETNRLAPGSAAGRAATTAQTAADRLAETTAHNEAMEGIADSQVDISQQNADTAARREAAYRRWLAWKKAHPNAKSKTKDGLSNADIRQWGKDAADIAYAYYNGTPNDEYDPSKERGPDNPKYINRGDANQALKDMLLAHIPYSIAWQAIYQYASRGNSRWKGALKWNKGYQTPAQRSAAKKAARTASEGARNAPR